MADENNKPVIFLAFANDRDDTVGYLRDLPVERKRLSKVLDKAEQDGLCEVVVKPDCTASDIFEVFQDARYRNRIAVFHYGGHANGYQLLLESAAGQSAAADAGGLAAFLAQQQGLQLVFLNGCSTQLQTQGLLDANISAVVSTSRSIDDEAATEFSCQFYNVLARGKDLRTAYKEAEAIVQTSKGSNMRGLYFGNKDDAESVLEADRWPWNLYLREGSENADQWNLPEAVNDPLFGLPPLPEQDLPESPFRHLNWFTRQDAEVFFGRGHQIRELYDRATAARAAPIILFYGQSGVGKSSILDAGLIPRLDQDYEVRYLRRTAGGLLDTLQLAFLPEASNVPIETAWREKEEQTGKPLIVFLDQLEEFYTRPIQDLPDELDQLLRVVKATFGDPKRRPKGKLVLGFRKEWLAELESHLSDYQLPRTKVFLEPLDRRGIIEVVRGPARSVRMRQRYGLKVEDGLPEIIADDLLEDRDSAIAPTMQILLTKMWAKATEANYEQPEFSQELYQGLKREGILLRDFLNQQIGTFREWYPEVVDSGLLLDIVALHTTPLGTADQRTVEELKQQYAHQGATLPDLLQRCQDLYLLTVPETTQKETPTTTRLAHDTLAPLIRERFDQSDKPGQRARRILDSRSVDWENDCEGTPLDEADLAAVELGRDGSRALNATEKRLLDASRRERLKRLRIQNILKIVGVSAVAVIGMLGAYGWWQRGVARTQLREANHNLGLAFVERAETHARQGKPAHAFLSAVRAIGFAGFEGTITSKYPHLLDNSRSDSLTATSLALRHRPGSHFPNALFGHGGDHIWCLAHSHDGTRVASGSFEGTIRIWDVNTHRLDMSLTGHTDLLNGVAFSKDDRVLASADFGGTIRLWDLTTEKLIDKYEEQESNRLAFSPDGRLLASGSKNGTVVLWTVEHEDSKPGSGRRIRGLSHLETLEGHKGVVWTVDFHPTDNNILASASEDNTIRLWNQASKESFELSGHTGIVFDVGFSPNGTQLASASFDETVRLWDTANRKCVGVLNGHTKPVSRVVFAPDGESLASTDRDGVVRIWSPATKQTIAILDAHPGRVDGLSYAPNGSYLATGCTDGFIRFWDFSTDPEKVTRLDGHSALVTGIAFSNSGRFLATVGWDKAICVWDFAARKELRRLGELSDRPSHVAFGLNEELVAASSLDSSIQIWRWDSPENEPIEISVETDAGHSLPITFVGRSLAAGWGDGNIGFFNVETGEPKNLAKIHTSGIIDLSYNPNGRFLASCDRGGFAKITDVDREATVISEDSNMACTLTSDGQELVTGNSDGDIRIVDVKTKKTRLKFSHDKGVSSLAVSADSVRIAASYFDQSIIVWDVAAKKKQLVFRTDTPMIQSLSISPDGRWLVYPGKDGVIEIVDLVPSGNLSVDPSNFGFSGLDLEFSTQK